MGISIQSHAVQSCLHPCFQYGSHNENLTDAAVMMLLQQRGKESVFILIERAQHLRFHGGEVAFAGGKRESHDMTPIDTAVREIWEELAIPSDRMSIAGILPSVVTLESGFVIHPVVAFLDETFTKFRPDLKEVSAVLTVPLSVFRKKPVILGPEFYFLRGYHYDGRVIWGATARIIRKFLACLDDGKL